MAERTGPETVSPCVTVVANRKVWDLWESILESTRLRAEPTIAVDTMLDKGLSLRQCLPNTNGQSVSGLMRILSANVGRVIVLGPERVKQWFRKSSGPVSHFTITNLRCM